MTKRITIVLEDEISDHLETLAGSKRKQSQYITDLITAAWQTRKAQRLPEAEQLRLQTVGLAAEVNDLRNRVMRLEGQTS